MPIVPRERSRILLVPRVLEEGRVLRKVPRVGTKEKAKETKERAMVNLRVLVKRVN